jgi:hypothetical protein
MDATKGIKATPKNEEGESMDIRSIIDSNEYQKLMYNEIVLIQESRLEYREGGIKRSPYDTLIREMFQLDNVPTFVEWDDNMQWNKSESVKIRELTHEYLAVIFKTSKLSGMQRKWLKALGDKVLYELVMNATAKIRKEETV